jgi:hypothetical protein
VHQKGGVVPVEQQPIAGAAVILTQFRNLLVFTNLPMKKFAIALCALTLGSGVASAADLPARTYTKAPPLPVAAAYDWSTSA